jgi:bacterial leucyl aminopeptidase
MAVLIESLRLLFRDPAIKDKRPLHTIEFHFYAGEEVGLLGSEDIFRQYRFQHRNVVAMLQQDMTGYTALAAQFEGRHMGIITDYTNKDLSDFVRRVVEVVSEFSVWVPHLLKLRTVARIRTPSTGY